MVCCRSEPCLPRGHISSQAQLLHRQGVFVCGASLDAFPETRATNSAALQADPCVYLLGSKPPPIAFKGDFLTQVNRAVL